MLRNRISFSQVFPDEPLKANFTDYLQGIPKSFLMRYALDFLSNENETWQRTLYRLVGTKIITYNNLKHRIEKIQRSKGDGDIVNRLGNLRFFEGVFTITENLMSKQVSQSDAKFAIFKAYLFLNEKENENESKLLDGIKEYEWYNPKLHLVLTHSFPNFYLDNYNFVNVLFTQFVKSCHLFQFLEGRKDLRLYLAEFLKSTNSKTWQEYLSALMNIIKPMVSPLKIKSTDTQAIAFFNNLVISANNNMDKDFSAIRAKPIFKDLDEENLYHILSNLFLLEKIYTAMYFDLNKIHKQMYDAGNGAKHSSGTIIKENSFKAFLGKEFVEETLLYSLLEKIYNKADKCCDGLDLETKFKKIQSTKTPSSPDFYVREGKKLYLFECKDALVSANDKRSYDLETIDTTIKKMLFGKDEDGKDENGNTKRKGILQLLKQAEDILNKASFYNFDSERPDDLIIYPIIVVEPQGLNSIGVNNILSYWFNEAINRRIQEKPNINWVQIKPVVLIDIDTLILYQSALSNGELVLSKLLDEYIHSTTLNVLNIGRDKQKHYIQVLLPFSVFMEEKYAHYKRDTPELREYFKLLFPDETTDENTDLQ